MIDIEKLKPLIVEKLIPLKPDKIILFGSYAYGAPNEDSDVDLYIVTNDDYIPQTFKEKSEIHLKVSRILRDLLQAYPTDLIIHTKAMHKIFKQTNSSFSNEIMMKGINIL